MDGALTLCRAVDNCVFAAAVGQSAPARGGALAALRRLQAADPRAYRRSLDPGGTIGRDGTAGTDCSSNLGPEHMK